MGQQPISCGSQDQEQKGEVQATRSNAVFLNKGRNNVSPRMDYSKQQNDESLSRQKSLRPHKIAQHECILRVSKDYFSGSQQKGRLFEEKPGILLSQILSMRCNTAKHFPEGQVVALLQCLAYSLAYLHKKAIKHHDYYPSNISFQDGVFKLANPLSIICSSYAKVLQRKRFSFLSPQLILSALEDTPEDNLDPECLYSADVFSIGMIVLEFCTLELSSECFDGETYKIIDQIIQSRIQKVKQLYNPLLADFISSMLNYNINQRISIQKLAIGVNTHTAKSKNSNSAKDEKPMHQSLESQSNKIAMGNLPKHFQVPHSLSPMMSQPNHTMVSMPNYNYSHIGPNNQGLLSPTTLHHKLKIIESIRQNPKQEQDDSSQKQQKKYKPEPVIVGTWNLPTQLHAAVGSKDQEFKQSNTISQWIPEDKIKSQQQFSNLSKGGTFLNDQHLQFNLAHSSFSPELNIKPSSGHFSQSSVPPYFSPAINSSSNQNYRTLAVNHDLPKIQCAPNNTYLTQYAHEISETKTQTLNSQPWPKTSTYNFQAKPNQWISTANRRYGIGTYNSTSKNLLQNQTVGVKSIWNQTALESNKNEQTLEQRVQRILQRSRQMK